MPLLSIITINFDNCAGLERTINSVVSQTFNDFDFVIIDGGSTDGSVDLIKRQADKINSWVSEKDDGIYDALNKGILKATGDYCLFLNSGDYFCSEDVLQNVFRTKFSEDLVYGDVLLENKGTICGEKKHPDSLSDYYLLTQVIAHQAQFIKRELFTKFGMFDKSYKIVSDYEFFVRMIYKHKASARHVPVAIAVFDLSGLSNNAGQRKLINNERNKIHSKYFPKMLVWMYHSYSSLLNSKVYKNPIVSAPVKLLKSIVFKFIRK
jgi:glycosyltransferase involved in cell wall biosynthesis